MRKPIILFLLAATLLVGCSVKTTYKVNGKEITHTIVNNDTITYIDGKPIDEAENQITTENQAISGDRTNEATLSYVAMNDDDNEVRKLAVGKLSSEATLSYVAMNDKDNEVRKLAVGKQSSESTLAYVAMNDSDVEVRKLAVGRSTSRSTLSYVSMNDKDAEIRKLALKRLSE